MILRNYNYNMIDIKKDIDSGWVGYYQEYVLVQKWFMGSSKSVSLSTVCRGGIFSSTVSSSLFVRLTTETVFVDQFSRQTHIIEFS